jgi:MSHA biogenesis protein MshK
MAGFVKVLRHAAAISAACACALVIAPALAQQLQDPTRPPSAIGQEAGAIAEGPVLQSVLIAPDRKVAIISGQSVKLGGQFNGAKLISISETQVVLRNGTELQTLKLFPDIDKHRSSAKAESSSSVGKTHRKQ